jgi:hypothetical protein
MDGILHWDFAPGLAVEEQVRRRFGSSVHFSPSSGLLEFFLVVSFSSASFPLSEDSVGWALQSCIGGDHHGFRVFQLSDRRFRFSVASNKVGHFIYGLRDRIWPDFVCHFTLFRGDTSRSAFVEHANGLDKEIVEVSGRSRTLLRPNLDFLKKSAVGDQSSAKELLKFGFHLDRAVGDQSCAKSVADRHDQGMSVCNDASSFKVGQFELFSKPLLRSSSPSPATSSGQAAESAEFLNLRAFSGKINQEFNILNDPEFKPKFAGHLFWKHCVPGYLPFDKKLLELAMDLRQANYEEDGVSYAIKFGNL